MAWAFSVLKDSHFPASHPVLTNNVSRCCNCPKAIPRKECGIVPGQRTNSGNCLVAFTSQNIRNLFMPAIIAISPKVLCFHFIFLEIGMHRTNEMCPKLHSIQDLEASIHTPKLRPIHIYPFQDSDQSASLWSKSHHFGKALFAHPLPNHELIGAAVSWAGVNAIDPSCLPQLMRI